MMIPDMFTNLKGVKHTSDDSYQALCPAHEDTHPSLTITRGRKAWLVYCYVGCTGKEIMNAIGLPVQALYYDYKPDAATTHDPSFDSEFRDWTKQSRAPTMAELDPHESLYDVLYAVFKVSAEVWATVCLRWEEELMKPFPDQIKQRDMIDAICLDLLDEHMQQGWWWTPQRRMVLLTKLHNEWAKGKDHGKS